MEREKEEEEKRVNICEWERRRRRENAATTMRKERREGTTGREQILKPERHRVTKERDTVTSGTVGHSSEVTVPQQAKKAMSSPRGETDTGCEWTTVTRALWTRERRDKEEKKGTREK